MMNLRKTFLIAITVAVAVLFQFNSVEAGYGSSGGGVLHGGASTGGYVGHGSSGGSWGGSVGGRYRDRLHALHAKKLERRAARRAYYGSSGGSVGDYYGSSGGSIGGHRRHHRIGGSYGGSVGGSSGGSVGGSSGGSIGGSSGGIVRRRW